MSPVVKIIQPSGILDGTKANQFRQEISDLVEAGSDIVLIDFQDVTFMDSSGLGALVLALKTVRAAGCQLFVCSINEQIRILFELTSMDRVFEIFPNREAFNSKKVPSPGGGDKQTERPTKKLKKGLSRVTSKKWERVSEDLGGGRRMRLPGTHAFSLL
jgi:anti-anti-sigma factor